MPTSSYKLEDLQRNGWLNECEVDSEVKHLLQDLLRIQRGPVTTPAMLDIPPPSTSANGAIDATGSPADTAASASSVAPAGGGRSPSGDPSNCGSNGTTVPINGDAIGTPTSQFDRAGMCPVLPFNEGGPVVKPPSSVCLTDDGGSLFLATDARGPLTLVPTDLFSTSNDAATIIAHRMCGGPCPGSPHAMKSLAAACASHVRRTEPWFAPCDEILGGRFGLTQ